MTLIHSCNVPALDVAFKWGRLDCNSTIAPNTTDLHEFPSPKMNGTDMFAFFAKEFDMTANEVSFF